MGFSLLPSQTRPAFIDPHYTHRLQESRPSRCPRRLPSFRSTKPQNRSQLFKLTPTPPTPPVCCVYPGHAFNQNHKLYQDFYDGHSWTSGLFSQGNGKSQESVSESINAYYGVYLLGLAIGDHDMRDWGRVLLAMETRAARKYWQMPDGNGVSTTRFILRPRRKSKWACKVDFVICAMRAMGARHSWFRPRVSGGVREGHEPDSVFPRETRNTGEHKRMGRVEEKIYVMRASACRRLYPVTVGYPPRVPPQRSASVAPPSLASVGDIACFLSRSHTLVCPSQPMFDQVYDAFFSSHRMVGMVASLEAVQRTW